METNGVARRNTNRLNRLQQRRLEDWVLAHWGEVEKFKWSQPQVAQQAGSKLGFAVTAPNVRAAATAVGKAFPRGHAHTDRVPRQALVEVIRLVVSLAGELGKTVPPILKAFLEEEGSDRGN